MSKLWNNSSSSPISLVGSPLCRIIHAPAGAVYVLAKVAETTPMIVIPILARILGGAELPLPAQGLVRRGFGPAVVNAIATPHELLNFGDAESVFLNWAANSFGNLTHNLNQAA